MRILFAIFLVMLAFGSELGDAQGQTSAIVKRPPLEVDVVTVPVIENLMLTEDLPGRLHASHSVQIRARIEGVIEKRLFTEGSEIKAGTPLFQINARKYQAAAMAAESELKTAQAQLERYRQLLKSKAVSQQDFDVALARVKQAEAAQIQAQLELGYAIPKAPVSGHIGKALVVEGQLVGKNEASHLVTIDVLDPIRVEFNQSYAQWQQSQPGPQASQEESAAEDRLELLINGSIYPQKGRIQFSEHRVDPASGTLMRRAEFPNPMQQLLPGAFVHVRVPVKQLAKAVRVPQRAVSSGPQGRFVMSVDSENKVVPLKLSSVAMQGDDFIVSEGLRGGERIIVNGLQKVRPGAEVSPKPLAVEAPASAAAASQ